MKHIHRLQETLQALGYDPGPVDDDFGPRTATAYVKALREHAIEADDPIVVAARDQVAARTPKQSDVLRPVNSWLVDDPTRPGYGTWRSESARAEAKANLRTFDVPLLGRLILDRRAAGPIIAAWGEIECLTEYRPGKASSMCYRRMNRDVRQPWSVHCTGYAVDADLDQDGTWERIEAIAVRILARLRKTNPDATMADALALEARVRGILESWGLVLGLDWHGKNRDDMHISACRV